METAVPYSFMTYYYFNKWIVKVEYLWCYFHNIIDIQKSKF
jgi:hypothetical protein